MSQKRGKEGVLSKKDGMRSNWKQFNFKYGQAYFQYFKGTEVPILIRVCMCAQKKRKKKHYHMATQS